MGQGVYQKSYRRLVSARRETIASQGIRGQRYESAPGE